MLDTATVPSLPEPRLRLAVVGAGVAGLSAAWLLSTRHDVTLYEQAGRLGGHANTVDVETAAGPVAVDTGFIVYNTACYPNLIALLRHLEVATAPAAMSFAVSLRDGAYEYSGSGVAGLFGQPANLLSADHWRLCADIPRFFRAASRLARDDAAGATSLGDWLAAERFSDTFVANHILPMGAAIWSAPTHAMLAFPARAFVRFFANHGLLQARGRPQWRTVRGGSRVYVERLAAAFGGTVTGGADALRRTDAGVVVTGRDGRETTFDQCVLACHADQALELLADADKRERALLSAFGYARNRAILHSDARQMPRRRRLWSSWNYLGGADPRRLSVSYWMNKLQPLAAREDMFVTLNPARAIAPDAIHARFDYAHPVFDAKALAAQAPMATLQGRRNTWFAGSYLGFGFHEDALQSGLWVAEMLGSVRRPWQVPGQSDRLQGLAGFVPPTGRRLPA